MSPIEVARTRARVVLIYVVSVATLLALLQLAAVWSNGGFAFAQATPTSGVPTIQFLNPEQHSSEVSDKPDGVDSLYHLVAWVSSPPSGARVEFQIRSGGSAGQNGDAVTCANTGSTVAAQVGSDTYECFWDVNVPEGSYTMIAILADSSNVARSRDEQAVTVNAQANPSQTPTQNETSDADTVEITYPTNGGGMGFYTAPGGQPVGIVEVSTSATATNVTAYYAVEPPGGDPDFKSCGTEAANDPSTPAPEAGTDGIRCTLPSSVRPEQVTAIAASVTGKEDNPLATTAGPDSGDAHRAIGYTQTATQVAIAPSSQSNAAPEECSQVFAATVFDHLGQQIASHNVDVHAQGPNDQLRFDDNDSSGNNTSSSKAPDQNAHATESTTNCESTTKPRPPGDTTQGEHEVISGNDIKHIESAAGTDDSGSFRFQLYSPVSGETQFTAWADKDGNDSHCSTEPSGSGSIGWGVAAPSVTGVPADTGTCPTGTSTGTPTGTPTSTATATPTGTSTTPSQTARTITLASDKSRALYSSQVIFSGQVLSQDASCVDNEFVTIQRRVHGTNRFRDFTTATTDDQGRFGKAIQVLKSADYTAVVSAHDNCAAATSDPVTVLVKVRLFLIVDEKDSESGEQVRFKSAVRPQHDGSRIILQRKQGKRWVNVETKRTNDKSVAVFSIPANWEGKRDFRTFWPAHDEDHEKNKSRVITVTVR